MARASILILPSLLFLCFSPGLNATLSPDFALIAGLDSGFDEVVVAVDGVDEAEDMDELLLLGRSFAKVEVDEVVFIEAVSEACEGLRVKGLSGILIVSSRVVLS